MARRILMIFLAAALVLSLAACGGGKEVPGETRTVYTMDTVMTLPAYVERSAAALDAAE